MERLVGLQAERREAELARLCLERLEDAAGDAEAAGAVRGPHALDLADAALFHLERAAADRSPIETGDKEISSGRRQLILARRDASAGVEAHLEARRELRKVSLEAGAGVGAARQLEADLDGGGPDQPLDLAHRGDEALTLARAQGRQHGVGERIGEAIVGRDLGAPLRGQGQAPASPIVGAALHADEILALERPQEPAGIAGVEPEPLAQLPEIGAPRADLIEDPRLAERAAAVKIAVLEGADALRDDAVEAADLLNLVWSHSLTLVRDRGWRKLRRRNGRNAGRGAYVPSPPSPTSSASPASPSMCSTETTRPPSAVLKTRTPFEARLTMRMPSTGTRMSCPPSLTSMIWSEVSTGKAAASGPISSIFVGSVARMPLPPRPEVRNSKDEERLQ